MSFGRIHFQTLKQPGTLTPEESRTANLTGLDHLAAGLSAARLEHVPVRLQNPPLRQLWIIAGGTRSRLYVLPEQLLYAVHQVLKTF